MGNVSVRYIVSNVDDAISFYEGLGFTVEMHPAPTFAMLGLDDLKLLLNQPGAGGAGQAGSKGDLPEPGGWNRFQLQVDDLEETVQQLKLAGASFRTGIVQGNGGKQAVVEDPSGNPVELFQPG